jgi:hypothetical protein
MSELPDTRSGILLRVEWVRARMHTWRANSGDPGYIDLDDPNVYDAADRRYLDPSQPSVRAYLERIRAEGADTSPGEPDDIDELRRRAGLPPAAG